MKKDWIERHNNKILKDNPQGYGLLIVGEKIARIFLRVGIKSFLIDRKLKVVLKD